MADSREIMNAASKAKDLLIKDRVQGERAFEALLKQYPFDGMIYLKRAEAWEFLEEIGLARNDYADAARLLTMPKWKQPAENALRRLDGILKLKHARDSRPN
ncbi:MAG: hypothetical protein ACLP1Y_02920 [Candidatus Acidiferrales bacterium]